MALGRPARAVPWEPAWEQAGVAAVPLCASVPQIPLTSWVAFNTKANCKVSLRVESQNPRSLLVASGKINGN